MSNLLFARATALANKLITADGEVCIWTSTVDAPIEDADKPWIQLQGTPQTTVVTIFFTSASDDPLRRLLSGSDIEGTKLRGLMPAQTFKPNLEDSIARTSDGSILQLESITPLAPNGVPILWKLVFKS